MRQRLFIYPYIFNYSFLFTIFADKKLCRFIRRNCNLSRFQNDKI